MQLRNLITQVQITTFVKGKRKKGKAEPGTATLTGCACFKPFYVCLRQSCTSYSCHNMLLCREEPWSKMTCRGLQREKVYYSCTAPNSTLNPFTLAHGNQWTDTDMPETPWERWKTLKNQAAEHHVTFESITPSLRTVNLMSSVTSMAQSASSKAPTSSENWFQSQWDWPTTRHRP